VSRLENIDPIIGNKALKYAAQECNEDLASYLLKESQSSYKEGQDDDDHWTPLCIACYNGNI